MEQRRGTSNAIHINWAALQEFWKALKAHQQAVGEYLREHKYPTAVSGTPRRDGRVNTKSNTNSSEERTLSRNCGLHESEDPASEFSPKENDELATLEGLAGEIIGSTVRRLSAEPEGLYRAEKAAAWLENMAPRLDGWVGEAAAMLPQIERKWKAGGELVDHETKERCLDWLQAVYESGEAGDPTSERARRLGEDVYDEIR